jgi:hypothetical protein
VRGTQTPRLLYWAALRGGLFLLQRVLSPEEDTNGDSPHSEYLGLTPGLPNSTKVTIQADPGTSFEDCFGMSYVGVFLTEFDNVVQGD